MSLRIRDTAIINTEKAFILKGAFENNKNLRYVIEKKRQTASKLLEFQERKR